MKQLEDENRKLKQLVADLSLDKHMGTVITATATSDISADGKRLTLKRKTLNGKAAPTIEVLAFDKK